MIYQVDDIKKEVDYHQMSDQHMYIGMMNLEELKECYEEFGIEQNVIESCEETSFMNQNTIIPYCQYYYGYVNLINARNVFIKKDALSFFIFQNFFLVVVIDDEDQHISEVFQTSSDYVLDKDVSITRLVYYFLSELITKDYQYIEELQEEINQLQSEESSVQFTNQYRHLSQELLLLRNYYDNIVGIGEELQMNQHQILKQDDMRYFEIFTNRMTRLSNNVQMLRDMLNEVNSAHQSQLDYKLNKTMQFFTIVTTIFMPLTLITGWYGMNFKYMPELNLKYSYFVVMIVSLLIVFGLIVIFKKKKFF